MRKIGFIDYFLDEWHANNYPGWISEASGGRMEVAYAYGKVDSPSGRTNAAWCESRGIQLLGSIEEVVEASDYLIVLAPDHPEFHEELAKLPLQSGKPTYVDKTFAPDRVAALRLFELAARHGTPMYSSSALRFASEYVEADRSGIEKILSVGPGLFENYAIHQFEPIVSLMGSGARRVMWTGTPHSPALLIGYEDGRQAEIHHFGWECPFGMTIQYGSGSTGIVKPESDFFASFTRQLISFFESGQPAVDPAETVAIITLIEYGRKAAERPHKWLEIPY